MNDFSNHQIAQIRMLEQECKIFDGPGIDCIRQLGGNFSTAEFSMNLIRFQAATVRRDHLILRLEEAGDFDFMVTCSSQAFGDSEAWTRNYFTHTREPERVTYIAMDGLMPVGMIRVNHVHTDIAVIHDFCVLPSYQGKGYDRGMLACVVNLLLNKQCTQIRLGVVTQNRRALNLYQSIGFEVSAESHYYVTTLHKML